MNVTDINDLVEQFDVTAKTWGWESDQGYGASVDLAKSKYEKTKAALIQAITDLSAENAALRAQLAEAVAVIKHYLAGALSLPRFAEDEARAFLAQHKESE